MRKCYYFFWRCYFLRTVVYSVLLIACLLAAKGASAGVFPVINGNNTGAGSLRQAIIDANAAGPGPHTISFSVTGVITITSSLPAITVPGVTIDGGGTVTISGPAANDNAVALFILNTGASNTAIKGMTLQNTGLQPITINGALSGVTLENLWLRQTGVDYMNYGIYVGAAATNMTIRNVTITDLQKGTTWGIRFRSTVSGLTIEGLRIRNSGPNHLSAGNDVRGIQFEGAVSNATIKNSTIDLDAPGSADDGNYAIYCNTTVNGFTMDSVQIHDAEVYHLFFGGAATNVNLNLCVFDNFDGYTGTRLARFNNNVNTVTVDSCTFNGDQNGTANDADAGLEFYGATNQNVTITNNTFTENDVNGLWFGHDNANNHDNVLIKGNTLKANGSGTDATGGIRFYPRNLTGDGGQCRITENTFIGNNGVAIGCYPGNGTSYVVPNVLIDKNIIYTTKSTLGAVYIRYVDKIVVSQNSIYNNVGRGIELIGAGNCGYEGANTPQLLSSAETAPGSGIYTISVKMPTICGTNACSLELFSNEAGIKGVGGQHYVQTFTGLGQGVRTLTNVTGAFPEITAAPYGTWTATLRAAANCGTSEFSNKVPIQVNGPAGINLGVKLWLRGDEISVNGSDPTADGQVITGWEEFSGGGGPSGTTVINNPLTKLNGINFNPVADMDGDGIRGVFSGYPTWLSGPTTTSIAVFNPLSATAGGDRFFCLFSQAGSDANTNAAQIEFYRAGNNIQSYRGSTLLNPPIPGTSGVTAFNRPGVFSSVTSASNHTSYYNGANMGSGNYNKGNFAISQWFIGTGYNSGWNYQSETDFAEVFTYNRVLTAGELQKVQSYMALKYGIAMKQNYILSDSTVVWNISTNAAYSKEIAALVRDNLSILHQKQAKAFHNDEVVTIAVGSELAATNNDNAGNIANNRSVLIWGNDSASTALTQTFTAGAFSNTRMARVWKVQKTNWADTAITIKLNNGKDNNYLLISTDPTFATLAQEVKLKKDGTVTINSALLSNGVYFTFGRQQRAPGGVVTDLDVWVKADEGVTLAGVNATAVEDQSASQRKWPKVRTEALPLSNNAINYNPAFMFGDSAYFSLPQFTPTYTQGEVFSVQSSAVNIAGFPFQLGGSSNGVLVYYRYSDNNMYLHWGTNTRRQFSFGTKNMALPAILNLNTLSNSWTASLDGKVYSTAAYTTSFAQYANGSNAIGVGYGSYFRGPMSEVVQYKRKLNATERQQVNSYLALKYGITMDQTTPADYLASNGTTMWSAAGNPGFGFNIAGIGRDDNGSLYQKQSRSINTAASGNLIAVALGNELAVSNETNTDSISNDRSFLVWGDNNGTVTYTANVTAGANVTLRMPRVWKVDKTNWADTSITIKLYGSARNTYLLISNSDATFATIDQEIALNGDSTITINSSLLPDGAYFTFGKEILGPGYVNASIVTWQRADDGLSGSEAWYDFSGNGNDATQAVVVDQPALLSGASDTALNFNPGFLFKPSVEWFDYNNSLTLSGTANKTVIWAAKSVATATAQAILSHGAGGQNLLVLQHEASNRPQVAVGGGGSTCTMISPSAVPFGTQLIGTYNRTSASSATMYTNGSFPATATCNSNFVASPVRIGARNSAAFSPFNGAISEVIVYDRSLAPFELQRVHSYLALKYGVTLDQTTPTDYVATDWNGTTGTKYWTAADNTGYRFRIAGIGKDELTKLNQKQSRSADANAIITIAAGDAIAADNASNTATIDDLSFFTWSDNNLATTFTTAVTGVPNATFRMARVWKVDRTNWADQDITIQADKIGVRYLLVNATDPTFGTGTTEYIINTTTNTVTLHTADLPDGAYFTLATKIVGPGCVNNGILTWLRADYNGTPSAWNDFSGNQVNAVQPTAANQPLVAAGSINFNPALSFDGTNDSLRLALNINPGTVNPITAFTLYNADVVSANSRAVWGNDNGGFDRYMKLDFVAGNGVNVAYTGGNVAGKPIINSTIMNDGPANGSFVYINNARVLNFTQANSAGGLTTTTIGNWGSGGEFDGKIGEVVFYNRALDTTERLRINSYLALKYGITLNQTVPTDYVASDWNGTTGTKMWTAADNTGYSFRITGIGRDDCDELHQKQSRNQDGGLVTVAIGNVVAATNAGNTDTIVNNNSYFVFADNNLDTTWTVPLAVSGITPTVRMPRIWKVDKTNWADADIIFKYGKNPSRVFLLVSTDPTFTTGVQQVALNTADSTASFTSDLLPDDAYFTFAREVYGPGYVNNGVQFWLRADDGTSTVSQWNDFSGNDNDAVQATAANQPLATSNAVNFNPGFELDGTNDYLSFSTNAGITGTNPFTVISVTKRGSVGTTDVILGQNNTAAGTFLYYYGSDNRFRMGATTTGSFSGTGIYSTANIPYLSAVTRGPATNLFSFYTNGAADGSSSPAGYSFTTSNLNIGVRATSVTGDFFDGNINELIVYNRSLDATELLKVNSYLALKYGITLNNGAANYVATDWNGSAGTVYWNATANTGYNNNIAGIGRDDSTSLLQKQSRSINTTANGNMVAIGLESIAATNKDNTATFTNDLSFMMWGDNGLPGMQTTEYPAELDPNGCSKVTRLQREWKVQETGAIGFVQVQFDLAGLGIPNSTTISDLTLLVDDDGNFGNGGSTVITPSAYDAATQTVTFNDVDFTNGQYFTLVTDITNEAPGGVLTNLYTWYRADKGVTTATGVSQWDDQSASVKNVTQATNQPAYNTAAGLINFNPSLTFDGVNDVLSNAAINHTAGTSGEDIFAVVLPNNATGPRNVLGLGNATAGQGTELRFNGNILQYTSKAAGTIQVIANSAATNGLVQLANANRNAAGAASLLLNGASVATGTINQQPANTALNIGARRNAATPDQFFNGQMAEIAIYNTQLAPADREKIASYLAMKYGITVPHNYVYPNNTVIWDQVANTGYANNITGIGRDDCNGLHQKQSKSINAGAIVIIAAGSEISASNAANLNTLENSTALLFGDNNAAINVWIATGAPAGRNRVAREWKAQLTGTMGAVTVQVPASTSTATAKLPAEVNKIYMLVDADGDFSSGAEEIQMTLNGTNWEASYEFSGNAYFTFATGTNYLALTSKVILQGAWDGTAMRTDLKTAGVLPATDPYGQGATPAVSPNASAAQVVDWVRVELRDALDPAVVVSSRAAFVLANGNIVDTSYAQPLAFYGVDAGSYYVVVRHRNHLGVMSSEALDFSSGVASIDFAVNTTATYGTYAQKDLGSGVMGLWAGNVNGDVSIRHSAKPSDGSGVQSAVLNHPGNTAGDPAYTGFINAYSLFDVNLDGRVYYTAAPSDRDIIVNNVTTHPANVFGLASFVIMQQLP